MADDAPRRSAAHESSFSVRRLARLNRRWPAVVAAVCLVFLLLASSAHVRVALKSAGFMVEIFPDMPAYPLRWFSDDPERKLVLFPHGDGYEGAYLYRPANGNCHAGMVLYIGLGPEHQDPHLDRAARAFARNGIAVLVPVSEAMIDYRLDPEEDEIAVSAFQYLQARDHVDPARVGMFGVSVGGSIVANAAQNEQINTEVAMVHSLGGYFDALDVLASISLGATEIDGEWTEWEPASVTIRATRNSILRLLPAEDRAALWPLFDHSEETIPEDLTEESEALARLLVNRDPDRVQELIDDLPPELVDYLRAISPSQGVGNLKANTLILHDVHDHVLHYSESLRFYDRLEQPESARLTLIEQFHHVRPDEDGDRRTMVTDGMRLLRHIYHMKQSLDDRGWFVELSDLLPWVDREGECGARIE